MAAAKRTREDGPQRDCCLMFVKRLWEADTLAMFHHPVSATEVPGYHEVISTPMDLSTIKRNIEEGKYQSDADVQDDVALMISNALDFNESGTAWHDQARQFRRDYIKYAEQSGLAVDEDSAFIPTKKFKDEEKTLRQAERRVEEKLNDVLDAMEKDKEIPLEELRAKYARTAANDGDSESHASSGSGSDSSDDEEDDDDEEDYDDDEEDDEDDDDEEDESSSANS